MGNVIIGLRPSVVVRYVATKSILNSGHSCSKLFHSAAPLVSNPSPDMGKSSDTFIQLLGSLFNFSLYGVLSIQICPPSRNLVYALSVDLSQVQIFSTSRFRRNQRPARSSYIQCLYWRISRRSWLATMPISFLLQGSAMSTI